jgi:hypothetical protein
MHGPASLRHLGHVVFEGGIVREYGWEGRRGKNVTLADISLKMNGAY